MKQREIEAELERLDMAVAILACLLCELNGRSSHLTEAITMLKAGVPFGIYTEFDGEEIHIGLRVKTKGLS